MAVYPDSRGAAEPGTFQQLLLMPPARPNGRCRLYRSLGTLPRSPDGRLRPTLDLCSQEVEKLAPQEYILEIAVAKNGFLDAVRWDGRALAVLTSSVNWSRRAPPAGHGIFGIAMVRGSAQGERIT